MFIAIFICYLAAFMIHSSRSLTRWEPGAASGQRFVWIAFVLHTWQLFWMARLAVAAHGAPLSNWHDWCLVGAWLVAAAYLIAGSTGVQDWQGVSLLPLVVGLLAIAQIFPQEDTFASARAYRLWGLLHGCCLLLGTVATSLGFSSGIMYLVQANRLKRKLAPFSSFRLPTLETLERSNEQLFVWSVFFLVAGILSGIILNLVAKSNPMPWTDPTIVISSVLLMWLIAAGVFAVVYRPARVGRKVAYLTVSSFLFLALTLVFVWFSPTDHARQAAATAGIVESADDFANAESSPR